MKDASILIYQESPDISGIWISVFGLMSGIFVESYLPLTQYLDLPRFTVV